MTVGGGGRERVARGTGAVAAVANRACVRSHHVHLGFGCHGHQGRIGQRRPQRTPRLEIAGGRSGLACDRRAAFVARVLGDEGRLIRWLKWRFGFRARVSWTEDVRVEAVRRFAELVGRPDPPLDRAALALAAGADPHLDIDHWLAELDRLAAGVTDLEDLLHRLFIEEHFTGNSANYYDPRNSLLPHVLTRRLGIPITLAVVCMEVGRRAGVPIEGVGMPGHFLIRPARSDVLLDVFAGGVELSLADCESRFRELGGKGPFGPHLLAATTTRAILVRMLENLRVVFRALRRPAGTEWVLRMRLTLPGADLAEHMELAQALGSQAKWLDGARILEAQVPQVSPETARRLALAARSLRAHLN
jgi:regulator of sirC expression with transglutaminase-like and TPR domain